MEKTCDNFTDRERILPVDKAQIPFYLLGSWSAYSQFISMMLVKIILRLIK